MPKFECIAGVAASWALLEAILEHLVPFGIVLAPFWTDIGWIFDVLGTIFVAFLGGFLGGF